MSYDLIMPPEPTRAMRDVIDKPLIAFNMMRYDDGRDDPALAILIRDHETDAIIGGLWAETFWGMLQVELLVVPKALRGAGLGRRILSMAEAEGQARGCHGAWLDTFSFQARGFYEKQGYQVFGQIDDYPPGHSRFFLKKRLAAPAASGTG